SSSILTNKLPIISPNQMVSGDCLCPPGDTDANKVQLTFQLEGLYNPTLGVMSSALVANDFLTKEQPFANATFNYFGEEQVEEFPTGTVDWLLLELRNTTDYSTVARQAVLLRADGKTINTKGESTIIFEAIFPDNYYLAVFHPAHIGILSRATTSNDLTQTNTFQLNNPDSVRGTNQLKQKGAAFVMVVGDTDQNGSINAADYVQFIEKIGAKGYTPSDLDGSGLIELKESELLKNNRSRMGYPKLFPQLKL
ncbi:MAG: hypothetical protein AB8G86_24935, partial [Saprospiraceae bacterium]